MIVTLTIWHVINGCLLLTIAYVAGFNRGWNRGFREAQEIRERVRRWWSNNQGKRDESNG